MGKKSKFGPGFLVAAAFIGPGTVTSATLAGAGYGYSLLWVIILAVFSAVILQEMVGRSSLATELDLGTSLIKIPKNKWIKLLLGSLAFLAIVIGCAAYEGGNIVGGSLGINILTGVGHRVWVILISFTAFMILWAGKYRFIEKLLIGLVVIMGISFFITGLIVKPDIGSIITGMKPSIPEGSITLILALLGTTIVPYNLFLHSSAILKKWDSSDMKYMRWDIILAVGLGGLITFSIIVTASSAYFLKHISVNSPSDLSTQLAPLFGNASKVLFGIGLFAAGLSSAITAPYAAAWTAKVSLVLAGGIALLIKLRIRIRTIALFSVIIAGLLFSFWTTIWLKLEENKQESSTSFAQHISSMTNVRSDASNLERINRWKCALRMFEEKPFTGWGPGTYMFNYAPFQASYDRTIISTDFGDMGNAHSEYLGPLSESGLPGLFTITAVFILAFSTGARVYRRAVNPRDRIIVLSILTGLSSYFIHGLMNNFLDRDKAAIPFWGFLAILVTLDLYYRKKKEKTKA